MTALCKGTVILASASKTRAALLRKAGLRVKAVPASIDEASVREGMEAEGALPGDIAKTLAELKALRVSRHHADRLVIGADQILACKGKIFGKPGGREAAAAQLRALSGSIHELASCVCVARDGDVIWHRIETAEMAVRPLSEEFITAYLEAAGESIYGNVGAYALEGLGIQLFSEIIGDYFSILGLPLLPLLDFLREHNIVPR